MTATLMNIDMNIAQEDFLRYRHILVDQGGDIEGRTLELPTPAQIDEEQVKNYIDDLDFTGVRVKLTTLVDSEPWSKDEALDAEKWYKMYIFLVAKYPNAYIVPNRHIDGFWHQHILDTRAYQRDCIKIFGCFHHHYPYAGMEGERDYHEWLYNTVVTEQLFVQEFGVSYDTAGAKCTCFGGKCKSVQPG